MTTKGLKQIISNAVATYGNEAQVNVAIEEMGELIVALNHYRRSRCNAGAVIEEIADVSIMMAQLAVIFGKDQYDSAVMRKLIRLKERLEDYNTGYDGSPLRYSARCSDCPHFIDSDDGPICEYLDNPPCDDL